MRRLEGKIAIVTGGADGLGAAMCKLFAAEGAKVIAADMADAPKYEAENVEYYKLNVTDVEGCKALSDYVVEKYGRIDILVNNAVDRRNMVSLQDATREKLQGLAKSDEDVLSYIAFPNLAEKFLEERKAKEENVCTYSIVEA
mgnify:CR=1 FL=1